MQDKVILKQEAIDKIIGGVNHLADAVKITMGAKGKFALLEDVNGMVPSLTKDGATVADRVKSTDEFEELGIRMVREATNRSLLEVQDGTTTATVLCQALVNNGYNNTEVIKTYKEELPKVLKALDKVSKRATQKQIRQVATLAANGDKEVGSIVSKAYKEVGKNGYIKVETTALDKTTLEVKDGFTVDSGLISAYFVTDSKSMECQMQDCFVLVLRDNLTRLEDIYPYIEYSSRQDKALMIFGGDINQDILQNILVNNAKGNFRVVFVRVPDNAENQTKIAHDIAATTGAEVTSVLEDVDLEYLGQADTITVRQGSTSITTKEDLTDYVKELEAELPTTELDAFLKRRIQNLTSKMVTIKVGGLTDLDLRERRDRIDDAVGAAKSAYKEGVVPGAGNALAHVAYSLDLDPLFAEALSRPMYTILENAEIKPNAECYEKLDKGFNVATGEFVDSLKDEGILDSTHSVKSALEAAVSVACNILNTECLILN